MKVARVRQRIPTLPDDSGAQPGKARPRLGPDPADHARVWQDSGRPEPPGPPDRHRHGHRRGSVGQVVSPRVCKTLVFDCGGSIPPRPTSSPQDDRSGPACAGEPASPPGPDRMRRARRVRHATPGNVPGASVARPDDRLDERPRAPRNPARARIREGARVRGSPPSRALPAVPGSGAMRARCSPFAWHCPTVTGYPEG